MFYKPPKKFALVTKSKNTNTQDNQRREEMLTFFGVSRLSAKRISTVGVNQLLRHASSSTDGAPIGQPTKMMASEAFVETLAAQGVTDVIGIVGSAFMDALDLFSEAGIRFVPVQHEQNAVHMADGYARICGKHGVCIAQNGPGMILIFI